MSFHKFNIYDTMSSETLRNERLHFLYSSLLAAPYDDEDKMLLNDDVLQELHSTGTGEGNGLDVRVPTRSDTTEINKETNPIPIIEDPAAISFAKNGPVMTVAKFSVLDNQSLCTSTIADDIVDIFSSSPASSSVSHSQHTPAPPAHGNYGKNDDILIVSKRREWHHRHNSNHHYHLQRNSRLLETTSPSFLSSKQLNIDQTSICSAPLLAGGDDNYIDMMPLFLLQPHQRDDTREAATTHASFCSSFSEKNINTTAAATGRKAGGSKHQQHGDHHTCNDEKNNEGIPLSSPPSSLSSPPTSTSIPPCKNKHIEKWQEHLEQLKDFKRTHGHCNVPNEFPQNMKLAQWVKRQRYQHTLKMAGKPSTMSDTRKHILEEIGFIWDAHECIWMERFQELQDFQRKFDHSNVPAKYPQNHKLSTWVKCQRRQYKLFRLGMTSNMTLDRIKMLDSMGFDWNPRNLKV